MSTSTGIIIEGRLLWPNGEIKQGHLISGEDGRISTMSEGELPGEHRSDGRVVQLPPSHTAVPGYIDVQINGGFGEEVKTNPTAAATLRTHLPKFGVTSFMPTVTSLPLDVYEEVLANIRQHSPGAGSEVLGIHLEGPFLNKSMRGGHPEANLSTPAEGEGKAYADDPLVRMVTLAPELDGAMPLIERLAGRGIVVGVGHSCADEGLLQEAMSHGLRWGTHVFNAMNPVKGREPGLAGFLLTENNLVAGLIADGIHVHPRLVRLAYTMKGPNNMILMTDCSAVTGLPPGTYTFRDRQITTDGVSARLPDGNLVGSILTLDRAVRNIIKYTDCTLSEAVYMASTGPARLLGLENRKGILAPGADADVIVLDAQLNVSSTIVRGSLVYDSTDSEPAAT